MLVLSRKRHEEIVIDGRVVVKVVAIEGGKVRLGIEAPKGVRVNRREVEDLGGARPPPAATDDNAQVVLLSTAAGGPSLDAQLDAVQVKSAETITLDFADVAHIYSTGLGKMAGLHRRVMAAGGQLLMQNLVHLVREIFSVTGLDNFFGRSP